RVHQSEVSMATEALLQRLAAVRGRLSLCADQAAAAKWWLSMPMASVAMLTSLWCTRVLSIVEIGADHF
ncbi:hypothetical protein, partial [Klebsiella pneumoniae]|uniref:hypothetical protein n=1 Tax=Klebsiella pneumoniae TaxID=573 RepID=UPI001C30BBAA